MRLSRHHPLKPIEQSIEQCMLRDRFPLRNKLRSIIRREKENRPVESLLNKLQEQITESSALLRQRDERRPATHYPEELPVSQKRNEIIQAILDHQVIVICGETGSGKTTQLPKMCLDAGLGISGMIGHTQPRRLAARSVANRIADELNTPLGDSVGFKVRFTDTLSPHSHIKLMTDGVLLAEIHNDPYLNQYDCIIVDEAHERSLNIDFLLGYLKRLIEKRKDLKIIITSATIDPERFSRHFNKAPILEVSGRTYPVEVRYMPSDDEQLDTPVAVADCIDEISRIDRGDILVFMSGERDIRETADYLSKQKLQNTEVLPLLARLSASEQNRIFSSSSQRRIVLSTNVAETSLTVPGIKYVIDTGLARISRYSWRSKIQRLPIEKISQASANQRKGRCGRVSAGICYRLYSEDDFLQRAEFTEPEIQRTNLAAVILTMEHLKLGHVEDFPFVEPPEHKLISDGYKLLFELGAINKQHKITETGKTLARLPMDPKLGRILIEANKEDCLEHALVVVSALSIQDPRERPMDQQNAADEAHKQFADNRSDFISWLNLWQKYQQARSDLSGNRLRKWCREHFISWLRMREWIDTHRQIKQMLADQGFRPQQRELDYTALHRSILTGFLSQTGFKDEGHEYQSCRQRKFHIFPGSDLFNKGPKWVVASDIVETQKVYARHLAKIEPQWISDKAGHLIKHSYSNPHWQRKSSQVSATRKSTLFGLLINPGTRVNYGPINPQESRQIFIRQALVQGDFNCNHKFYKHNQKLIKDIETLEAKSRRQDILVDDEIIFSFYDQHIDEGIYSGPLLNKWLKENNESDLFMTESDLMQQDASHISDIDFPDSLLINHTQFPLQYHFDPNHQCDGITLISPASALASLTSAHCEWLVPGLLGDKIIELIRSLPKPLRKNFVPAPDFARACLDALSPGDISLTQALTNHLRKMTGVEIPFDAWNLSSLPDHLFLNFRVIDSNGKQLAEGRDLTTLQQQFKDFKDEQAATSQAHSLEQQDIQPAALDDLPSSIEVNSNGIITRAYPALSASGNKVNIRLYYSQQEADTARYAGMRQLFINALPQQIRHLKSSIPDIQSLCLYFTPIGKCDALKTQIIYRVIDQLFTHHLPDSSAAFSAVLDQNRSDMDDMLTNIAMTLKEILTLYHGLQKQLRNPPLHWLDAMTDIQDQLHHLLHTDFIVMTEQAYFEQLPRYLKAIQKRLDKIQGNPDRDRKSRLEVANFWDDYKKRADQLRRNGQYSSQLEAFRWLIEEYRISLFAQELKTRVPVSAKRLKKAWNEISDA